MQPSQEYYRDAFNTIAYLRNNNPDTIFKVLKSQFKKVGIKPYEICEIIKYYKSSNDYSELCINLKDSEFLKRLKRESEK